MMKKKSRKIGEILIENGFIDEKRLEEALLYQKEFGGNITQYFIDRGYVKEEELAQCISSQFGCPYLPLRAYEIRKDVIDLLPSHIAEEYWMIPVDKMEDIVTIVMANPLDSEAVETVERITKCRVQPFVGILSDIAKAIEYYYDIAVEDEALVNTENIAPLFIQSASYEGVDRRKASRIRCKISIHFVDPNVYHKTNYVKAETKDVSKVGFLFESSNILPLNSYLNLGLHLPEDISPYPVHAVVQVVRIQQLANGKFDIGTKIVSMRKSDIGKIMKYAALSQPELSKKGGGRS